MNILFICSANAVRSPMAEGWIRHLADGRHQTQSAGIMPQDIFPLTVETMRQAGIDISGHRSRRLDEQLLGWADYIITLADSIRPHHAYFPKTAVCRHWSIPNPDAFLNPEMSRQEAYAYVRDLLRQHIGALLAEIDGLER